MYEVSRVDLARKCLEEVAQARPMASEKRAFSMAKEYALGSTLEQIGENYGISRERVRQIINTTPWSVPVIKENRRIVREIDQLEAAERDIERVQEWSHSHPGVPIGEAVKELGLERDYIYRVLGTRRSLHADPNEEVSARRLWSDEQLLELIRDFHKETGQTTSMSFEQWSVSRGGPTRQTPTNRFGSWATAVEKAGIRGVRGINRKRRYSAEDLWAAIIEFFDTERDAYSFQAFAHWLETVNGAPSASLVRSHLRVSWNRMARVALEVIHDNGASHDPEWVADVVVRRDWASFVDGAKPVQHVRDAIAELGEYLTCVAYRDWARVNNRPQVLTLMNRSGMTWTELVTAAGGRAGDRNADRISDEELFNALDEFMATGEAVRYETYNLWASRAGKPRAGTISSRFDGWKRGLAAYERSRKA